MSANDVQDGQKGHMCQGKEGKVQKEDFVKPGISAKVFLKETLRQMQSLSKDFTAEAGSQLEIHCVP